MPNSKTKSFTFWRARFITEPYSFTAQDLLTSAFDNTKVKDRVWSFDDENIKEMNYHSFINHKTIDKGFSCANFFSYEKGKVTQTIKESFDSDEIDSTEFIAPKAADGTAQQFLDGKLYYICFDNDLVIAQDRRLKAQHLEKYLNGIFQERCADFPKEQQIILERSISRQKRNDIKGVRRINFSTALTNSSSDSVEVAREQQTLRGSRAWDAIKAFMGKSHAESLKQFDTGGFIEERNISVTLSLVWKRKKGEQPSDEIDSLANTFRHVDDEIDIELETASGKWKYGDLRLQQSKGVEHLKNDMPDNRDIFTKMIDWHRILRNAGDI